MKKKQDAPPKKGKLIIANPTLETMLCLFNQITKEAASKSGIEYSNFSKACKMQQDLRISTYLKCASGFDKDVIILHLPKGLVESMVELQEYHHKRYYTIEQQELFLILHQVLLQEVKLPNLFEIFLRSLIEKDKDDMVKKLLSALGETCLKIVNSDGKE